MQTQFLKAGAFGISDRPWIWAAVFALVLALSTSTAVLAHGDEEHPAPAEAASPETTTSAEAETEAEGEAHATMLENEHGDHAHDSDDHHSNATSAERAHDHSAHEPNEALLKTGFGRFLVWLGKFHPAAVHFPIALLLAAAAGELLSLRYKPEFFRDAARFSLWAGAIGAVGAASLGWLYGGFHLVDKETVLTIHRWNGTSIAVLALLTLWLGERRLHLQPSRSGIYRTALFATALLVGVNGYLGGLMVYGPEQHQWPTTEATHAH